MVRCRIATREVKPREITTTGASIKKLNAKGCDAYIVIESKRRTQLRKKSTIRAGNEGVLEDDERAKKAKRVCKEHQTA